MTQTWVSRDGGLLWPNYTVWNSQRTNKNVKKITACPLNIAFGEIIKDVVQGGYMPSLHNFPIQNFKSFSLPFILGVVKTQEAVVFFP